VSNDESLVWHELGGAAHGGEHALGERGLVLVEELLDERLVGALRELALAVTGACECDEFIHVKSFSTNLM